jgi:hypothetical protein
VFSNEFADCNSMLLNGFGIRSESFLNWATWTRSAAVACCSWAGLRTRVCRLLLIAVRSPTMTSISRRAPSPSTA